MRYEPEFYVGYLPMPVGLRRTVGRLVVVMGVLVVGLAAILIAGQHPFAASSFEFQQYREFSGTLLPNPYPALAIPEGGLPWLLVGPGKHGVGPLPAGDVRLRGERIIRGDDRMIQLVPGSLAAIGDGTSSDGAADLGQVQLTGEIVDSKCYFGVMNPGNGKVHRDCAVRCISGGIPPAFLVRDAEGRTGTLLLASWKSALLDHVAEPITIRGRLVRSSGRLTLYAE
jgi:hypothetical protein